MTSVASVARLPLPAELLEVMSRLEERLRSVADVVPADPAVLAGLWAGETPPEDLARRLNRLEAMGVLRRLTLGREPHYALAHAPSLDVRRTLSLAPEPPLALDPEPQTPLVELAPLLEPEAFHEELLELAPLLEPEPLVPFPDPEPAPAPEPEPEPEPKELPPPTPNPSVERTEFDVLVRLDVERERLLLYRVLVVLEVLAGLVVGRELLLTWLGL